MNGILLKNRVLHATLFVLLLAMTSFANVSAQIVTIGDLNYQLFSNDYKAVVTGHVNGTNATGSLNIPSYVVYDLHIYTVTEICGFKNCTGLTSVTIPNTVTRIQYQTFMGCSGFTGNLVIPNSVTEIGHYAFYGCTGFTGNLTIPNSVTKIGDGAFYGCSGFTGNLTIPNSVTEIGGGAFVGCSGLTGVLTIPANVTKIKDNAFKYLEFSEVHYCAKSCYDNHSSSSPFHECSGILFIGENVERIPAYMFWGANFTGSLVIPDSVTEIGEHAFYGCNGFTGDLVIPNSVTSIGYQAFSFCTGFNGSLTIGNSVIGIGADAFYGCNGFTGNLVIPDSLVSIGYSAFYGCSGFTGDLVIPNSVTEIGDYAFYGCIGFNGNLTIGSSVTEIGNYAFKDCSGFTSMNILADTPPTISSSTFYNFPKSIPVYVPCGSLEAFQSADYWNAFTNMQEQCMQSNTITLSAGWNWFSTNLNITLDDLKTALVEALPNTSIQIKSKNTSSTYNGSTWRGSLNTLDVTQMYMIKTSADCTITLAGFRINPENYPITINHGVNWIGFPLNESISITDAFDGFAVNGDVIKSKNTSATYTGSIWRGTLNTLEFGKGYMYKSMADEQKVFHFSHQELEN